jgi:hypothetical protein
MELGCRIALRDATGFTYSAFAGVVELECSQENVAR